MKQSVINLPPCPKFKQKKWVELDQGFFCCICELKNIKQKPRMEKNK